MKFKFSTGRLGREIRVRTRRCSVRKNIGSSGSSQFQLISRVYHVSIPINLMWHPAVIDMTLLILCFGEVGVRM